MEEDKVPDNPPNPSEPSAPPEAALPPTISGDGPRERPLAAVPAPEPRKADARRSSAEKDPQAWKRFARREGAKTKNQAAFVDPTTPLLSSSTPLLSLDPSSVGDWCRDLEKHRLLLLQCWDEQVLHSAGHSIAQSPGFTSFERLQLLFGGMQKPDANSVLSTLLDPRIGSGRDSLIVAFAVAPGAEVLIESLPYETQSLQASARVLREMKRFLVVLSVPPRLRASGKGFPYRSEYSREVPYLAARLRHLYSDRYESAWERVLGQRRDGLWGDTEEEFLNRILSFSTAKQFEAELDLLDQASRAQDREAFLVAQSVAVEDQLGDEKVLESAVLFTATYFPRLPVDDFARVVLALIGERQRDVPVIAAEPGQAAAYRSVPLYQIWANTRSSILKKCCMRISGPGIPVVEFERPDYRGRVRDLFESDCFLLYEEFYLRVLTTTLLFCERTGIVDAALRLVLDRMRKDPLGYQAVLLEDVLFPLVPTVGSGPGIDTVDGVFRSLGPAKVCKVLERLAQLLVLFLDEGFATNVFQLLTRLVDLGCHPETLEVLRRIPNLTFSAGRLKVLRRLLNEGSEETRAEAYGQILRHCRMGGMAAATTLDVVEAWRKEEGTHSGEAARQLLAELCDLSMFDSEERQSNLLASAIRAIPEGTFAARIVEWLTQLSPDTPSEEAEYTELAQFTDCTFLWLVPKAVLDKYLFVRPELLQDLHLEIFGGYAEVFARQSTSPSHQWYPALVLADSFLCLSLERQEENRPGPESLSRAIGSLALPMKKDLRACWRVLLQVIEGCQTSILNSLSPWIEPGLREDRNALRSRWTAMKTSIRDLIRAADSGVKAAVKTV